MPTENRRVATYLPKSIDDRLKTFIAERNLKGDSLALITILSEFFGVSQEVAPRSSSVDLELQNRVEVLEDKIAQLKNELLNELLNELRRELLEDRNNSIEQAKAEVKSELLDELKSESLEPKSVPGQLQLIPEPTHVDSTEKVMPSQQPLSGRALAKHLGIGRSTISEWKGKGENVLLENTRAVNNGIGWLYIPEAKGYQLERSISSSSLETQESELLDADEPEF